MIELLLFIYTFGYAFTLGMVIAVAIERDNFWTLQRPTRLSKWGLPFLIAGGWPIIWPIVIIHFLLERPS